MEIVIDIPEDIYTTIKGLPKYMTGVLQKAVMDGIVLPKHHGDLVDKETITPENTSFYADTKMYHTFQGNFQHETWYVNCDAPTVVKAR